MIDHPQQAAHPQDLWKQGLEAASGIARDGIS
jgi:hypothetical protein